jgi:hypothetical protein
MNRKSNKIWKQLLGIASLLLLVFLLLAQPGTAPVLADGSISGTVFRDFNANGVWDANEPGIGGIVVTAVSDTGDTQTTTTDPDGSYTLPTLSGNDARVEFTLPTDGSLDFLQPGAAGGTTVQFVSIASDISNVDAGFNNPAQYSVAAPKVVVPRWTRGEPTAAPNNAESVIRAHDYLANGASAPLYDDYATYAEVGTIFGISHQTQSGVIFGSTYIRRGAAVGSSDTTGAIYKLSGTGAPSVFIDLTTIVGTGANPHPNAGTADWIRDTTTYPLVGKVGLGDLEISDDELTLYSVNLNDQELVIMPLTFDGTGQPVAPAPGDVSTVTIPVPTGCDNDDWRPFGLKFFDGLLYVGGVCTAESLIAGLNPNGDLFPAVQPFLQYLDAHVYVYDPDTGFNTTPILTIPLDYAREPVNDGFATYPPSSPNDGEWLPWTSHWRPSWAPITGGGIVANPQPMLTDIELDGRGFMYLGFRDRFSDQAYDTGDFGPDPFSTTPTSQRFGGDFLLACLDAGGNWQLESSSSCTNGLTGEARTAGTSAAANPPNAPQEAEFFHADQYLVNGGTTAQFHDETGLGTLAMLYGSGELVGTKYDAFEAFENGTITYDIDNGDRIRAVQVFEAGNSLFFRKAGGLGDIELIGGAAPIEVGNRIWSDDDGDGIQDPGEPPIPGVTVGLYDASGTLLNSAISDANGNYSFSNAQTIGTVVSQVSQSSDDAVETTSSGAVSLTGTSLPLGNNNSTSALRDIGLRFTAISVPQGATITSAYIQFVTDSGTPTNLGNPATFTVDGQAADNAATFAATAFNVSGRPRTTLGARVTWTINSFWSGANFNGPLQRTADLSPIVQEIVDRAGWVSGNAMAFIINNSAQHRDAESWDGSGNGIFAPVLVLNYSLPDPANYVALQYRTSYELRVNRNQAALSGYSVSPPTADSTPFGEIRDSDGQPRLGGYIAIPFTTGGPGANNHTYDFGFVPSVSLGDLLWNDEDNDGLYQQPVRVGDFVWFDLNSNGLQDAGEPGVGGVGVALHVASATDCTATPLATTTSAPNGFYQFDNVAPGNYFVCFDLNTLPPGFDVTLQNVGGDDTVDSDANLNGRTANTGFLNAGAQFPDMDMGIVNTNGVSVGDKVWYDVNGDGRQDSSEPGTPNVTVNLFTLGQSCTDTPVDTQITDSSGNYYFTALAAGNYFVCFDLTTLPPGYTPTAANNQADDSVDSDAAANGQTPPTALLTGSQFDFTLDMGIRSSDGVSIGDFVWYDDNGNGQQDPGEGGVAGIGVELYLDGQTCGVDPAMMTTTTAGDGSYLFSGLPSGNYFVCFDLGTLPAGFEVTLQNVGSDATDSDADPVTGATASTGVIPSGGSDTTLDMGIRQTAGGTVSVGDRVWFDVDRDGIQDAGEAGVPGVTAELHPATDADCTVAPAATDITDAQGNYLFNDLTAGDYFVCFDLATLPSADYAVTFQNAGGNGGLDSDADPLTGRTGNSGPLAAGETNMNLDMGIYATTHEPGLAGALVQIYAAGAVCGVDPTMGQVTTAADGSFLFPDLAPGQYYLHLPASNFSPGQPLEYMFASTGPGSSSNPDDDVNNDNNGEEVTAGACAGGISTNPVTLAVATEPTNDGNTDPNTPDISNNLTVDLGIYEPLCIGDQIWYDANDNGLLDGSEYGINGVNLDLYLDVDGDGNFEPGGDDGARIANTTTATVGGRDGSYSFCSVIPGDYFVHIPATEFAPGELLSLTRSSTTVVDPQTSDAEDDNNGDDRGDAAANGIVSAASVSLDLRLEPTADRDDNDNGRRDSSTNQTVDFGIALEEPMDFGDLPASYNRTIFGDNGPRHPDSGLYLGTLWDADNDGLESTAADGDDNDNLNDEDGIDISLTGTWGDGTGDLTVTVSGGSGCVVGWADFDGDGNFDDEVNDGVGTVSERLFVQFVGAGATTISFPTPQSTAGSGNYAYPAELNMRFRLFPTGDPLFAAMGLTLDGNDCPAAANPTAAMANITTGAATGGEVEDYQQAFTPTAVRLSNFRATSQMAVLLPLSIGLFLLLVSGLAIVVMRKRVR